MAPGAQLHHRDTETRSICAQPTSVSPCLRGEIKRRALWSLLCAALLAASSTTTTFAATRPVPEISYANGKLVYVTDPKGNRVLDYSMAGYMAGGVAIPDAPVRVTVPVAAGDATARLQVAIDYVSALPLDAQGIRPVHLERLFDCLEYTLRSCPLGCKKRLSLGAMILHLNDDHRWTREEIAAWVSPPEEKPAEAPAATPDPNAAG